MRCAECGCEVDRGVVVEACGRDDCCCRHLPRRADGPGSAARTVDAGAAAASPPVRDGSADPSSRGRITPEDAYRQLEGHPGWIVERRRIHRDYRFPSFRDAIAFVTRVADIAERAGHHPNILVHEWCFVRLELYSHVIDGVSQADVDLAKAVDAASGA